MLGGAFQQKTSSQAQRGSVVGFYNTLQQCSEWSPPGSQPLDRGCSALGVPGYALGNCSERERRGREAVRSIITCYHLGVQVLMRITSRTLPARTNGELHRIPRAKLSYCAVSARKTRVLGGFSISPSPSLTADESREPPHIPGNHEVRPHSPFRGLSGTVLRMSVRCVCAETRGGRPKPQVAFHGQ